MGLGKWISGWLGFCMGGPLGAFAGFALGWLLEKSMSGQDDADYTQQERERMQYEGQRNSFLFSLLSLASYIIRADGRVMHSEMELVRRFLRQNFGEMAVSEGEKIMMRLFEYQKQVGMPQFAGNIHDVCGQIADNMEYSQRLQLLNFLVSIAQADGVVVSEEIEALHNVALWMGISATDDEVKAAYRKMALKHPPDRVATLGEDVRKAAEKKFQEINEAKEVIYKARGL